MNLIGIEIGNKWKYRFSSCCYNWTLLELKYGSTCIVALILIVIIEPYWNWNMTIRKNRVQPLKRYNWTLLELKFVTVDVESTELFEVIIEPYWNWNKGSGDGNLHFHRYNWTLLELKSMARYLIWINYVVIIEPYWNWNAKTLHKLLNVRTL